jgi:hypothetical protein
VTCSRWWRWGESNSTSPVSSVRGQEAVRGATCGFSERLVTLLLAVIHGSPVGCRPKHGPTRGVSVPSGRGRLGAPALRDQDRIGRPGAAGPIPSSEPQVPGMPG